MADTRPAARLARVRRAIAIALAAKILLVAFLAGGAGLLASLTLDAVFGLPREARVGLLILGVAAAGGVAARLALAAWRVRSDRALALWVEHHCPLDYLLVTAADAAFAENQDIAAALLPRNFETPARRAAWRALGPPAAGVVAVAAIMLLIPAQRLARVASPRPGDVLEVRESVRASRLRPLVVRYTAPAYAGGHTETWEEATAVRGLEGGSVDVAGRGSIEGLQLEVTGQQVQLDGTGTQWHAALPMPSRAVILRLRDGADERLIALEPTRDSVPVVVIRQPASDSVLRQPRGSIPLSAVARDDIGLRESWFEYVVSSGTGELFQFRTGRLAVRRLTGKGDSLRGRLDLDSLALAPGDVLHVRAVAWDRGPAARGPGVSETRSLRIVRADESDTSAVIVMPPLPSDTNALSQRLLIQLAEALQARRPRLRRETVVEESRAIGRDQARLRRDVADVIFLRTSGEPEGEHAHGADPTAVLSPEELLAAAEAATAPDPEQQLDFHEDEAPVVAINRPLLEAYNAMWDATRELDIGEPGRALPPMYRALEAIQRARAAERVYLRGGTPRVVVNVDDVRLTGKRDRLAEAQRSAAPADARSRALARLLAAAGMLADNPAGGRDSLLVLRVDLLADEPEAAVALGEALATLRGGGDPAPALRAARSALTGPPRWRAGLEGW